MEVIVEVGWFWKNRIVVYFTRIDEKAVLRRDLSNASSFEEWEEVAEKLDSLLGNDLWRQNPTSRHYDYKLISGRYKRLVQARKDGDISALMDLLRSGLLRNLGSITTDLLYVHAYSGTKRLIEDYINEVVSCLQYIDSQPADVIPEQQRRDFFHDTRQSFGRSALVLHGGSLFGLCHLGTVKALHKAGLLPEIVSGSTVGAIVAALVCSCTEEELLSVIDEISHDLPPLSQEYADLKFSSVVEGVLTSLYPPEILLFEQHVRTLLGDMTFEEAYLRTERVLNITVTSKHVKDNKHMDPTEIPTLLNYLSAPHVVIWSAVRASIGSGILPGKVELLMKNHLGEIEPYSRHEVDFSPSNKTLYMNHRESPYTRLSELFNVNSFIVSLTRPYFAPLFLSDFKHRGPRGWGMKLIKLIRLEFQHRLQQLTRLGILPSYIQRLFVDENIPGGFQVTIVPELPHFVRDFVKTIDSHNIREKVDYWIWIGERSVWPMMAIVWSRSMIEITLNSIFSKRTRVTDDKSNQTLTQQHI